MTANITTLTPARMAQVAALTPAAERPGLSPWLDSVAVVPEDDSDAFYYSIGVWAYDDGPFPEGPPRPVDPYDGGDYCLNDSSECSHDNDVGICRAVAFSLCCHSNRTSSWCALCNRSNSPDCIGEIPVFDADRCALIAKAISLLRSRGYTPANFTR